jgi:hypothetical protein
VWSLGYAADGKRIRRKVTGKTRTEAKDKLKDLQAHVVPCRPLIVPH